VKTVYNVKSPTRVDLAGGTLDLWPLYNFFGGAKTINIAIDVFTYAELEVVTESNSIEFISEDLKARKFYASYERAIEDRDPEFALFRIVVEYFKPNFGFRLRTRSESPVGGGLGGSSSLLISMLKVFSHALLRPFASVHKIVEVAHNLEAQLLLTPTGTQDYYPAVSGGINCLEYSANGVRQELYDHREKKEIEDRFLLVYTGRSHHSGMNNFEVLQKAVSRDAQTIRALSSLRLVAEEMSAKVRAGLWGDLSELFRREYDSRIQLAPAISSPEIETLHKLTLNAGAEAVKICGAGGGGCVLVWCAPGSKANVAESCKKSGFQILAARPHSVLAEP
jgi:D-glycero-alpha-D-manno-heptose-7-phosphate kinase